MKVTKEQILLTCSGTVGQCTIVGEHFANAVFSHDLLRLDVLADVPYGYVYAFLRTRIGQLLLKTSNYGSVIQHIEPSHLASIGVPLAHTSIIEKIHGMIARSFAFRDEANAKIVEAWEQLKQESGLPDLNSITERVNTSAFSVPLSGISGRLESKFHDPKISAILGYMKEKKLHLAQIGDKQIANELRLPGQFKRVYVQEGYGIPFFSGKDIGELDPYDKKYLAYSQHNERIESLKVCQNMILVTCSGTVGNVALVPRHWDGWAMTHDIIRLIPRSEKMAGYAYTWLSSEYGRALVQRFSYGAVVQHIEEHHLAEVPIPILDQTIMDSIGDKVLQANELRARAYEEERDALNFFDDKVFGIISPV